MRFSIIELSHSASVFKKLPKILLVLAITSAIHVVVAEEAETKTFVPKAADAKSEAEKKKAHLMSNIDIFGKTDLPAIYILMPSASGDEDIRGSLLTRDFSRDEFFMQNVDREEFELKITLREIGAEEPEKKKDQAKR